MRSKGGKKTATCIDSRAQTIEILLPTKSSAAPSLNAGSYVQSSLHRAGEAANV